LTSLRSSRGTSGSPPQARARYDASLSSQLAGAHANLGTALVALGDSDGAIREYRLALAGDPNSAATLVNLGLTLAARNDFAEARQRLEEALRLQPDLFAAHLKLGEILLSGGMLIPATEHLKRAAESPDERIRRAAAELLARH
jgi:tetratricopeptide (TPR) repeat protein